MERTPDTARPFTSPASVSVAALALVLLAGASFTSGLTRQLRQPRPDNTARVVVMAPKETPAASVSALAYMAPVDAPPPHLAKPRRHVRPPVDETPPTTLTGPPSAEARAAPLNAADAAAIAPVETPPAPAPEAEPTPPSP
jgi:hypothetical protein